MVALEDERDRRSDRRSGPGRLVAIRILAADLTLARERGSDRFTVFDGWIPEPGPELDPTAPVGPAVSASRLETLGQCPLKYFFRYVLEIEPPEELTLDPRSGSTRWRADLSCTRCSSSSSRR